MAKAHPIIVLFLCFVLFGLALAQERPDDTPTQPQPSPSPQQLESPRIEQPLYLTGTVMYADGSPADMTAKVELWCDGRVRRQVHTFSGRFTLQVGGRNLQGPPYLMPVLESEDVFGAGSSPGLNGEGFGGSEGLGQGGQSRQANNPDHMNLISCELRAEQAGFQSETIPLTFRRPLDNPDVGVLVLYRAGRNCRHDRQCDHDVGSQKSPQGVSEGSQRGKKRRRPTIRRLWPSWRRPPTSIRNFPRLGTCWEKFDSSSKTSPVLRRPLNRPRTAIPSIFDLRSR